MRVGCYIRVSTQEQAKEGYSIPAQSERLKNYCLAREWDIFGIYSDPGYSGAKTERPALQKLISDIQKGRLDLVLVYKLDRLSRSQKDTLYLIEDVFLKNNVDFVSINENFDTSTAFGRAMIGILSVFAQLEREQIKERTHMGQIERAKDGLWRGGGTNPAGYDYNEATGQLEINEYEAMQVREAFDLYVNKKYSLEAICKIFNEKGYRTKNGCWEYRTSVKRTLMREIYAGKIQYDGIVYPGRHEAIVSQELFDAAQVRLGNTGWWDGTMRTSNPYKATQLLSGIIYCKQCGARYFGTGVYRSDHQKPPGRIYVHLYSCYSRVKSNKSMIIDPNCKNKAWPVEELDEYIINEILKLNVEEHIAQQKRDKAKDTTNEKNTAILKQISALEQQEEKLLDLYQFGSIDSEKVARRMEELQTKKSALLDKMQEVAPTKNVMSPAQVKQILANAQFVFQSGTIDDKRLLVQALIQRIDVDGNSISIHWGF